MSIESEEDKGLALVLDRLFVNRRDSYAIQQSDGQYFRVDQPLTIDVLQQHACKQGELTVGVYQLNKDNMVKWLCNDLDPEKLEDPLLTASQILKVCLEEDQEERPRIWPKAILLEASRHPDNSIHLWVFFEPPVHAKVARWLGLRILELGSLNPKQIEVFPKQTELTKELPYGNCVKLPLGFHREEKKWSRFLNLETFEPLSPDCLFNVEGISFSEEDLQKIMSFEEKRDVQIKFDLPRNFKPLPNRDEEKAVRFLVKYWKPGYRNQLELSFLGWAIKKGISAESAHRIIKQVCMVTATSREDTRNALQKVRYPYQNRRSLGGKLLGISGLREIVEAMK